MEDFVSKGTGNSRYLKSAIPKDITFEEFINMLRAGTIPVDLAGLNPEGYERIGTAMNKKNLLSDATSAAVKALVEGTATPETPNDAMNILAQAIAARVKIQTGSYVGTGTYGADNPCSLTFDFEPKIIMMLFSSTSNLGIYIHSSDSEVLVLPTEAITTSYLVARGFGRYIETTTSLRPYGKKSDDGKTYYWYTSSTTSSAAEYQFNRQNATYWYAAIG